VVIPLGQELSDLCDRHGTASLDVANALINGCKGLLVFLLVDGGRLVEVNSSRFRHVFKVARIGA